MKHYLIKNADGSVGVMKPVMQPDGSYPTPEELLAKWHPTLRAAVQSWREIDPAHLPTNRTFRNAWRDASPGIFIDMPKARDIHRDRLRALRAPKLAELDIEMFRRWGDPQGQKAVETQKQALRDVTADPSIEAAKTPEELLAAIPDALKNAIP